VIPDFPLTTTDSMRAIILPIYSVLRKPFQGPIFFHRFPQSYWFTHGSGPILLLPIFIPFSFPYQAWSSTLKMEDSSKTLTAIYPTAWHCIPEDSNLHELVSQQEMTITCKKDSRSTACVHHTQAEKFL
jgi:hypothetical protein